MRFLLFILLMGGFGYVGHLAWKQNGEVEELRRENSTLRMELDELKSGQNPGRAAGLPPSVATSAHYAPHSGNIQKIQIACPSCRASGKVTIGGRVTTCRLCTGVGNRTLSIPVGAKVCQTCQGMARTSSISGTRQTTDGCRVCGARGYGN